MEVSLFQLESMAHLVENAVEQAIRALVKNDAVTAREIIEKDKAINSFEIDIDNSTYNFLALSTRGMPAELLRKVLSIQKINPMLERIGDHAANVAEAVLMLDTDHYRGEYFSIVEMGKECFSVLQDALSSFFLGNSARSEEVLQQDDVIDEMHNATVNSIKTAMLASPPTVSFETGFALFRVARDFERIADLSMNIAEETLYAVEGAVVKHREPADVPAFCR